MHAYTRLNFKIDGNKDSIKSLVAVVRETIKDVTIGESSEFFVDNTYDCVFEEDIEKLVVAMSTKEPDVSFVVNGTIDTSESAGELRDFIVTYKDKNLIVEYSDWYIETWMESYDDYEDFCDSFFECSEEEYLKLKEYEFVYLLEASDGDKLSDAVPMIEKKKLLTNI